MTQFDSGHSLNIAQAASADLPDQSVLLTRKIEALRHAIGPVLPLVESLGATQLNAEQQGYAVQIGNAARLLLGLLDETHDIIAGTPQTIESVPFDLYIAVEQTVEMLAISAHSKNLEIVTHIQPLVPRRMMGDPGRIRQILGTLIGNAIKFTASGHIIVEVACTTQNEAEYFIQFAVRDTGSGFQEHHLDRLASTSPIRENSGLAQCRHLLGAINGILSITNNSGPGATLSFIIPLSPDHTDHALVDLSTSISHLRIVIAEPNPYLSDLIKDQFEQAGICFTITTTADATMASLRKGLETGKPVDIAIIGDQLAPGGGEVLGQLIKATPELSSVLMVLLATAAKRGDAARAAGFGFSGYLTTPLRQTQMLEFISALWSAHQQQIPSGIVTRHLLHEYSIMDKEKSFSQQHAFPAHILIAEDNEINQLLARRIFDKLGCHYDIVHNGEEVINLLYKDHYDIIFMDCHMPMMDGLMTARCIRTLEKNSDTGTHIPIIGLAANVLKSDRDSCLEAGMDDYLYKPLRIEAAMNMLTKWTNPSKAINQS